MYQAQLVSRIGAKALHLTRMRHIDEGQAYILQPLFGQVERAAAKRFMQVSQGYWREPGVGQGVPAADGPHGLNQLTVEIIDTAEQWMAQGRRAPNQRGVTG